MTADFSQQAKCHY